MALFFIVTAMTVPLKKHGVHYMRYFILPAAFIAITIGAGCHSGTNTNPSPDTAVKASSDTVGQQMMPQTPVSKDSAGARKEQEKSSMDTVRRP
jgi:hypothetical protein